MSASVNPYHSVDAVIGLIQECRKLGTSVTRDEWHTLMTRFVGNDNLWEGFAAALIDVLDQDDWEAEAQRMMLTLAELQRLDKAFVQLETQLNVVARSHFACCNNCGVSEMMDEIDAAAESRPIRGWIFYNQQNTELAFVTSKLDLVVGDFDYKFDEIASQLCAEIAAVLHAAGFRATAKENRMHIVFDTPKRLHAGARQQESHHN